MNRFRFRLPALFCVLLFAACGPSTAGQGGPDGQGGNGDGGSCQPGLDFCRGNQVVSCTANGTPGSVTMTCPNGCQYGTCMSGDAGPVGDGGSNCAAGATDLVYVVDNQNTLYSFDPTMMSFNKIGNLNCPAGLSLDPMGGAATPFSMSVDRNATAWVLYSSGEIFHVSTKDASCSKTNFQPEQMNYDVFGMGFVSNTAGSNAEKLFVSGSTFNPFTGALEDTRLGYIDPSTLKVTNIKALNNLQNPPELTGTGDAKLYGYFPGSSSYVAQFDKSTGAISSTHWPAGSVSGQLDGWAFAQWGGKFYVFVTTGGLGGFTSSKVVVVDPKANGGKGSEMDGKTSGVPFIVGAGVSTCAPVVVH